MSIYKPSFSPAKNYSFVDEKSAIFLYGKKLVDSIKKAVINNMHFNNEMHVQIIFNFLYLNTESAISDIEKLSKKYPHVYLIFWSEHFPFYIDQALFSLGGEGEHN